jgi:hypothetical protein
VPLSPNYDEDDHDHDVKYDEFSTPSMSWDCFDCTVNIMMNWIGILILTHFHKIYYCTMFNHILHFKNKWKYD